MVDYPADGGIRFSIYLRIYSSGKPLCYGSFFVLLSC